MALLASACATGTTLVTGQARAPVAPEAVQVYMEAPPAFETIGAVSEVSALGVNAQQNLNRAMADVKARAAALGANGVVIDYIGAPGGALVAMAATERSARAIFVP